MRQGMSYKIVYKIVYYKAYVSWSKLCLLVIMFKIQQAIGGFRVLWVVKKLLNMI